MNIAPAPANWNYPTTIWFGPGRIEELPQACTQAGIQNPLLVTDPGLVELPPVVSSMSILRSAGINAGCFCDIKPNPVGANVLAGTNVYHAGNHDGIVAIGGGSAMDAGKAIAFQSGQTKSFWDFEDMADSWLGANAEILRLLLPFPLPPEPELKWAVLR